jgi:hypothetical protein
MISGPRPCCLGMVVHNPGHKADSSDLPRRGQGTRTTLRTSTGSGILQGKTSTQHMLVPLAWFRAWTLFHDPWVRGRPCRGCRKN